MSRPVCYCKVASESTRPPRVVTANQTWGQVRRDLEAQLGFYRARQQGKKFEESQSVLVAFPIIDDKGSCSDKDLDDSDWVRPGSYLLIKRLPPKMEILMPLVAKSVQTSEI